MHREQFATGEIYHVFNRGADKRQTFMDTSDYSRFVSGMYTFNDAHSTHDLRLTTEVRPREKLVEIMCYCLMPNHFHFMLRQVKDGGITTFMRKLGTSYSMYFNKKYERSGVLFQGKFKSVYVNRDVYLQYLPHYIHLNPLELSLPNWQSKGAGDYKFSELIRYPWSSLPVILGRQLNDHIVDGDFIKTLYPAGYEGALREWMSDAESLANFKSAF